MPAQVEQEPKSISEVIKERPEEVEIPPEVERATGVQKRPTQISAHVTDTGGAPLMQTPARTLTITIPASPQQLSDWSKGSASLSLTWFAAFWLRMIKKALAFGWRVISGGG